MSHEIHVLDVFAQRRFEGNQLAVVPGAGDLATADMQDIARETNFSETTFIVEDPEPDSPTRVRIFTPAEELPFAGHPTLGTAWLIRHRLLESPPERVTLSLGIGEVPVAFEGAGEEALGFLRAPDASFGATVDAEELGPALALATQDISTAAPIQQVTAGLEFLIVPLASADALSRCRPRLDRFEALADRGIRAFVYAFCSEPRSSENDVASRFFFDANGLREDPATGSATGALGHYLVEHRFFGGDRVDLRIEQGTQMLRPSLLHLRAAPADVRVGGRTIPVVKGALL